MRNRIRRKPCADLSAHHYAQQSCACSPQRCRGAHRTATNRARKRTRLRIGAQRCCAVSSVCESSGRGILCTKKLFQNVLLFEFISLLSLFLCAHLTSLQPACGGSCHAVAEGGSTSQLRMVFSLKFAQFLLSTSPQKSMMQPKISLQKRKRQC